MKKFAIAAASLFVLSGVAACGESATDKAAEKQADALNAQADQVEKNADRKADMVEQQAGNADGGMTTSNTPSTH